MNMHLYLFNRRMSMTLIVLITSIFSAFGQGFSTETEKRLQEVIEGFISDPDHPFVGGISAAINVDGLAIWQGASGFAARSVDANNNLLPGGTPFETNTLSRIYSITKTFTAPLVLQLVQEGYFKLEDPITKYIPQLNIINPGLNPTVTIRQLLAHESGYSDYVKEPYLQVAIAMNPFEVWTPYQMLYFVRQERKPGEARRYSSTNYVLLGAIIEVATKTTVEKLFRQRFFDPLDLKSMYLSEREDIENRGTLADPHANLSALNYFFPPELNVQFPNTYTNVSRIPFTGIASVAFTGGGIISNVLDVSKWGNALFGGRATSKSILDIMLKSISDTPDPDGDKLGYGLWTNTKISATEYFVGHNGAAPGYRTVMFYQPDRKMTIAVLTNFDGANAYAIAKALFEALPDFIGGNENRKEDKIVLCWKGSNITVARQAADGFIKKGAYLGGCSKNDLKANNVVTTDKDKQLEEQNSLKASPNPFYNKVTISFTTVQPGAVNLSVYDIYGKLVAMPFKGVLGKNVVKHVDWNAGNLPAGIYFCRLQTVLGLSELRIVLKR